MQSIFGAAIDTRKVLLKRRKWFLFQPRQILMAPCGHVHFHPRSPHWCDDFAGANMALQGLFLHEMTHVWQAQTKGWWYLPICRSFSRRYDYSLKPGWTLDRYGIEQQAEIVRHAFLLRQGVKLAGVGDPAAYDLLVDFSGASQPR
ncbi:MAG: vgr related protein [Novosphingobium sp.]